MKQLLATGTKRLRRRPQPGRKRRLASGWKTWATYSLPLVLVVVAALAAGCSYGGDGSPPAKRVIVLGFDGVDPDFVEQWIDDLPHIKKLMSEGTFRRLQTTTPPASCTAWTSFATGMNPGGHGIFDFIYRDPKTYLPDRTGAVSEKAEYWFGLFPKKPETFHTTMTGEPFWKAMDRAGLRSVVLRVPCVFPLEHMQHGHLEGGLGAPDMRGTEGTFHYFTSELTPREAADPSLGGKVVSVTKGAVIESAVEGPINPLADKYERISIPVTFRPVGDDTVDISLGEDRHTVKVGQWSEWFRMAFPVTAFSKLWGIARFRVVEVSPEIKIYLTPISYDPSDPAIRLTEPWEFSEQLYDAVGNHKTVGWNHETWGLNEERIDEDAFMEDVFATMRKTEEITFHELDSQPAELLVSVFVEPDRTSHMMYRLIDPQSPRYDAELAAKHGDAIKQTYLRMDEIIGKVMSRLTLHDTLLVLSDHGFHSWRRGFNLNTWLIREGYMHLKDGADHTDQKFLMDVDWSETEAYALGLGAIYLNLQGREGRGIVPPSDARAVASEIAAKLKKVVDPKTGKRVIDDVYLAADTWSGTRLADAQDLQIGMAEGYRVSSATPLGGAPEGLFEDNLKKWSGDHAASDTAETEAIFLSNRKIADKKVAIEDLAPTILKVYGVPIPDNYTGKALEFVEPDSNGAS